MHFTQPRSAHLFHVINPPMLEIIARYQFALSIESISLLFLPSFPFFLSLSFPLSSSTPRFHPAEYTCQSSKCISAKRRPLLKVKKNKRPPSNKSFTPSALKLISPINDRVSGGRRNASGLEVRSASLL